MSIRVILLFAVVAALAAYAWKDWFVALCGLVVMTLLSQHHDMPRTMFGIPGLNPWNFVYGMVLLAFIVEYRGAMQLPRHAFFKFVVAYVILLILGAAWSVIDWGSIIEKLPHLSFVHVVFDLLVNPLKYLSLGVLMYVGCQSRRRVVIGLGTVLVLCFLHSLLMYKAMKLMVFFGDYDDARRLTDKTIGLHANDLAGLLTMGVWSLIVLASVVRGKYRYLAILTVLIMVPTLVGCHSRAAYLANIALIIVLGVVKWRKLLIACPVVLLVGLAVFPQIGDRLTMGLDDEATALAGEVDWNQVTAGRTVNIWEPTFEQILVSPLIGYGRKAIVRTDCAEEIFAREGEYVGHPHNSYLEVLLDSGLVGLGIVVGMLACAGMMSLQLLRDRRDPLMHLVGGIGLVAVVNVMALAVSSNFLYPKQSMLWLICTLAITARLWMVSVQVGAQQQRVQAARARAVVPAMSYGARAR